MPKAAAAKPKAKVAAKSKPTLAKKMHVAKARSNSNWKAASLSKGTAKKVAAIVKAAVKRNP